MKKERILSTLCFTVAFVFTNILGFLLSSPLTNSVFAAEIVIEGSNMCLDMTNVPTGTDGKGRKVIAWPCHGGENQNWTITAGQVRTKDNMCLDMGRVPTGTDGKGRDLNAWPCHSGANQKWTITLSGQFQTTGNMCLDMGRVPTGTDGKGRDVNTWPCHGGGNQKWTIR